MLYFAVKYLHLVGAAVLLGTGAGIAFFQLMAHRGGNVDAIAAVARIVVIADFLFTATAVVLQPITGVVLAGLDGYPLGEGWIVLSIALYLLTGVFWLPVVWMQIRMRDLAIAAARTAQPLSPVPNLVRLRLPRLRCGVGDLLADDDAPGDRPAHVLARPRRRNRPRIRLAIS